MRAELCLRETAGRLQNTLRSCVSLFREGEDSLGLDALIGSVEDLERLLDIFQCTGTADLGPDDMLSACLGLLSCMQNQDATGMTDLLEFTVIPCAQAWVARGEAICG